jgi:hypothetical protein
VLDNTSGGYAVWQVVLAVAGGIVVGSIVIG